MELSGKCYDQSYRLSLWNLSVLCVSVVSCCRVFIHHGGTEDSETAQRRPNQIQGQSQRKCFRINVAIFQASMAFQGTDAIV